ncbi:hypothetical protein RhiJN_12990 [Ceratobasidium sp. AG-Ba]|nr:hypothetical protein RhiJN_12990 [Ceratobasidium sp. AG-Ba]QRW13553.1 hypothetical protein RhiLY_12552 [Ceratobasidium sp. AG-Ba]
MLAFLIILCIALVSVTAAPANVTSLNKRTIIADGNGVRNGGLPDWNFRYRASGYVAKGCPPGTGISICYEYRLSSDPTKNLDKDSENHVVQRDLFYSSSKPADGKIREYTFRMKIDSSVASAPQSDSLPLVGLETRVFNVGDVVMTIYLDARDNTLGIYNRADRFTPLVHVPLADVVGKRIYQRWTHKSGPDGWTSIEILDEDTQAVFLS